MVVGGKFLKRLLCLVGGGGEGWGKWDIHLDSFSFKLVLSTNLMM